MSSRINLGNSKNSLSSWISDHLGKKSYMTDEVSTLPSSSRRDFSNSEGSPLGISLPSLEKEECIMTQDNLDRLRESCFIPSNVQIRLPEASETIDSACRSEVAFYEAAFHTGLHLPIHPTIRMILQFYNICPAQLVPNAWWSVVCAIVLWRAHKYALSLSLSISKFRN